MSFDAIINWLEQLSKSMNLELFVVLGSFLEEIIAPIPSPFVMTTAAALAQQQNYTIIQLFILAVVAAAAKTASSYVVYFAADKAEDVVIGKFGKFIGVDHKLIEKIGAFLTGTWFDDFLLLISRALPFVPTVLVSVGAGVIKYNVRSFLIMTFIGSIFRNIFYLWVGYVGVKEVEQLWQQSQDSPLAIAFMAIGAGILIYMLWRIKEILFEKILASKKSSK